MAIKEWYLLSGSKNISNLTKGGEGEINLKNCFLFVSRYFVFVDKMKFVEREEGGGLKRKSIIKYEEWE